MTALKESFDSHLAPAPLIGIAAPSSFIPFAIAATLIVIAITYAITTCVHRLYFHPLSKFPGAHHAVLTDWVYNYYFITGDIVRWVDSMHTRYGDVVRLGPNRLSYIAPAAWKDIYGHKTATHKTNPKDAAFFRPHMNGHHSLVTEPSDAEHARLRRVLSHAFSDRALRQQEGFIQEHVDQLMGLMLKEVDAVTAPSGTNTAHSATAVVDAVRLYNFTTFDIMGSLTFGEPLGNLRSGEYVQWVHVAFGSFKWLMIQSLLSSHSLAAMVWERLMTPRGLRHDAQVNWQYSVDRVTKRLGRDQESANHAHSDIWGFVLKQKDKNDEISRPSMDANSEMLMTAGSETTATLLSGLTWLLLKNPDKLKKLTEAIRSSVSDASQLRSDRLRHIKFLGACIEEGLRCYPPVAVGNMREVAPGGNRILDDWLPEKTRISVAHYSAYKSPRYWKDPEKFVPERWLLDEPGYEEYHAFDRRETLNPFSMGPRNCIGRNLAYYEARLILAHILFYFDLQPRSGSEDWINQKNWIMWDKRPLNISISLREEL